MRTEVTGLDLESITSKVKQFTYDNGSIDTVVEATFNGDSVLQSVLQKINENM